jgi:plastocyanin
MRQRHRFLKVVTGGALAGAALLAVTGGPTPAHAAAVTLNIGVDNAPPSGHNWEFLDFFPRSGVNVHDGDTLHFVFNATSLDGFHSVVFGKPGETPTQIATNLPNIAAESGDAAGTQDFAANFGSHPPPGSGAPGACGNVGTPCIYDGTSDLSSGPMFNGGPFTDFYYKIQLAGGVSVPATINYICNVHGPAMSGTFTIVTSGTAASTQAELDAAAATQYSNDVAAGQSVESSVGAASVTTNADGTHTVGLTAGAETSDGRVQILEMLPNNVSVTAGDKVTWTALSHNDPHTVTFPQGSGSNSADPFPFLCEIAAAADNPAAGGPPTFGCPGPPGSPTGFEVGFVPGAAGPTSVASTSTVSSSGILDAGTYYPGPTAYTFTFPNTGTFLYQCRVHNHMTAQIVVVAAVATPPTGSGVNFSVLLYVLPPGVLMIALASLMVRRRLTD